MVESAVEVKKETTSKERQPWTPKGIWGHKDPAEMTLEEKQAMLKRAKYSGPLATAYWENEIDNHNFKPDREEAEKNKKRVGELEEESDKLKEKINSRLEAPPKEDTEDEVDQTLLDSNEEELKEKKKGIGTQFKDGVLGFYSSFKAGWNDAWSVLDKKKGGAEAVEEKTGERPSEERRPSDERGSTEASRPNVGSGEPSTANPERDKKIEALKQEITNLREERYQKSREGGVIEQGKIEEEYKPQIKALENQILELEKEGGDRKKIDRKGVVGFLWERTKGFVGGFGWWEAHQAEKFRLGTKEVGKDLQAQTELLQQEAGLFDIDEARTEAYETEAKREKEEKDWIENQGAEPEDARRLAVDFLSAQISSRKKKENQRVEDQMVASSLKKFEDKLKTKNFKFWDTEYKTANEGEKVIAPEKMKVLEEKIRQEIGKLRKGQVKKDLVNFIKLSRNSLDDKWWSRYIYAGLDAVLAGLLMKWVVSKYVGAGVEKAVASKTAGGKAVESKGVELATKTGLKDTIWGESKRMLVEQGVNNPTAAQIQNVATQMAQDSGVKVISKATGEVIWQHTAAGAAKDIALSKGFLLKLGGANKIIAGIKAGMGLI